MAKSYSLKIITPQEVAFEGPVISVVAPAQEGYVGVLADHAPFVTTLKPGSLTIKTALEEFQFRIGKGFFEVLKNQAVLLTEKAVVSNP